MAVREELTSREDLMADSGSFSTELDELDQVANSHLSELVMNAESVCTQLRLEADSLPLWNPFPGARELKGAHTELHEALYQQHSTAAQALRDTAFSLTQVAQVYRTADGQS